MREYPIQGVPYEKSPFLDRCGRAVRRPDSFLCLVDDLCSEACNAAHLYKLFGAPFETFGFIFFPMTLGLHFLGRKFYWARMAVFFLLASAVGSEISFILIQKYEIGRWCPLCLSIAGTIAIAATVYLRSGFMKNRWMVLGALLFSCAGFLFANTGIAKDEPFLAAEKSLQDHLSFGKQDSPIQVYFFTDWQCPACRALEPKALQIASKIMETGSLFFVDTIIHVDSLNFVPYNLSFMVHDKANYFQLRNKLSEISKETGTPTDAEIEKAIAPLRYKQLPQSEIAVGNRLFKSLADQFEVGATPTMVIVDKETKKKRTLVGKEITEAQIMKAIQGIKKGL